MKDHRDIIIERVDKLAQEKGLIGARAYLHEVMDEYKKESCLELLEWIGKNNIICCYDENGVFFNVVKNGKIESLSKEQLFENFL